MEYVGILSLWDIWKVPLKKLILPQKEGNIIPKILNFHSIRYAFICLRLRLDLGEGIVLFSNSNIILVSHKNRLCVGMFLYLVMHQMFPQV